MPDLLKAFEKAAKAVRGGILAASDNLAFLVGGLCRAPEPEREPYIRCDSPHPDYPNPCCRLLGHDEWHAGLDGSCWPNDPATPPPVVAPSPKQGSDSGPADSDIPPSPAGPHPGFSLSESLGRADPDVYGTAVYQPHGFVDMAPLDVDPLKSQTDVAASAGPHQTCKHCNERIEPGDGVNVWLHSSRPRFCRTTYATPK